MSTPSAGFTVKSFPVLLWTMMSTDPSGVAAIPLELNWPATKWISPDKGRAATAPGAANEPSALIGTLYRKALEESVNQAASRVTITSLMNVVPVASV